MEVHVSHTPSISGCLTVPSSKSQTVRALLLALLGDGTSVIRNMLDSDDTTAALECIQALGAAVVITKDDSGITTAHVTGTGLPIQAATKKIFTRNSGITTRFLLPMLGLAEGDMVFELDCGEQMRSRPIEPLCAALRSLGMTIESGEGPDIFPLRVSGRLRPRNIEVDGITSQYISALLLSLPWLDDPSEIFVNNLNERPYVEMTVRSLETLGVSVGWTRDGVIDIFKIQGGARVNGFDRSIPADFSSASCLIAAGVLLAGAVTLEGFDFDDPQGDKRLIEIVREMGADISVNGSTLQVKGGRELVGIRIDCNDIPDLVPALAVIGTAARGVTELVNVPQARLKETDRIRSMATELAKMGARISEVDDGLRIEHSEIRGAALHGYSDHRTIMALSIAGLIARGSTIIDTAEGVSKTYPEFVRDIVSLGANMKME